jgi:hypothetical protein
MHSRGKSLCCEREKGRKRKEGRIDRNLGQWQVAWHLVTILEEKYRMCKEEQEKCEKIRLWEYTKSKHQRLFTMEETLNSL